MSPAGGTAPGKRWADVITKAEKPADTRSPEEILRDIVNAKDIEGVTFLGGEPFEQADVIKYLAENIQKSGLSVICFTGNRIEELIKEINK